jgi:hypothetical protein
MKNFFNIFIFIILFFIVSNASAQNAFQEGDQNLQIGIGYSLEGIYGDALIPPISISYEVGYNKKLSFGGQFGFATSENLWVYWDGSGGYKYSYIIIGARGTYHFLDHKKFDPYVGVFVGYSYVLSSWTGNENFKAFYSPSGNFLIFGTSLGCRYYLNPKLAVFGEVGYGINMAAIGICFKM